MASVAAAVIGVAAAAEDLAVVVAVLGPGVAVWWVAGYVATTVVVVKDVELHLVAAAGSAGFAALAAETEAGAELEPVAAQDAEEAIVGSAGLAEIVAVAAPEGPGAALAATIGAVGQTLSVPEYFG